MYEFLYIYIYIKEVGLNGNVPFFSIIKNRAHTNNSQHIYYPIYYPKL